MNLSVHFFASSVLALALFPFYGFYSLLTLVGGFLIDVDHYIYYAVTHKNLSLKKAYWFHKDNKPFKVVMLDIFHTVEFWLIMLILSPFSRIIFMISLGILLHMLIDLNNFRVAMKKRRRYSIIYWLIKRHS